MSTTTLQTIVDYAKTFGDIQPVLGVGGFAAQPALTIATDVLTSMLAEPFNWKWNRVTVAFVTNGLQQDYATTATNVAWLEQAVAIDINNNALPKPIFPVEVVRDLSLTSGSTGRVVQVCWLPNDQLTYGTWVANTAFINPMGAVSTPQNPITQIRDANGNLQVLTTYGTTGSEAPTWATANGATTADGTCVWTKVDPQGQGFRVSPLPSPGGVPYQIGVVAQKRAVPLTALSSTLSNLPDDFIPYFRQGFIAHCYRHSPEASVRSKFGVEFRLWQETLQTARGASDRERENAGFYPEKNVMGGGYTFTVSPANPYFWGL